MSRRIISRWIAVLLIGALAGGVYATTGQEKEEQEEKISLDQLPELVKKKVLQISRNTTIAEIEREVENGKTVYEIELVIDTVEIEVELDEKGTIIDLEIGRKGSDDDDEHDDDDDDDDDDPDDDDGD